MKILMFDMRKNQPMGWAAKCSKCSSCTAYDDNEVRETPALGKHILCAACTTPVKVPDKEKRMYIW